MALALQKELKFEYAFAKAGGLLIAGADPTGNGGALAGFADQRNIELLVEAGFTPIEAIRIATSNGAKFLGARAGYQACLQAVLTHGGMGYSKEFHVERYLREVMIPRIAPITPHMILNFIAEKVLGLPKSY